MKPIADPRPSAGAIVIAPAWSACGSYQVFKGQIETLKMHGFETYFLAAPHYWMEETYYRSIFLPDYRATTKDIGASCRGELAFPKRRFWSFARRNRHFQAASVAAELCKCATLMDIPSSLIQFAKKKDELFVLCNHYFNVPLVERLQKTLKRNLVFALETHDIQSNHFQSRDDSLASADVSQNLHDELGQISKADCLIHLNDEEYRFFQRALPTHDHRLIYPGLAEPAFVAKPLPVSYLLVGSYNEENAQSVAWFLENVWSRYAGKGSLTIAGDVARGVEKDFPATYHRWAQLFAGRVSDLSACYAKAAVVIVPTLDGEGISIKLAEALSYKKRVLFTKRAVRGLPERAMARLKNGLCLDAEDFLTKMTALSSEDYIDSSDESLRAFRLIFSAERHVKEYQKVVDAFSNKGRVSF